jgi:hypothetical protein
VMKEGALFNGTIAVGDRDSGATRKSKQ